MDVNCSYCGSEDGRFRYGHPSDEEAIGEACIALVRRDIEDQFTQIEAERQQAVFDERWRTIQEAEPTNWAVHRFHNVPAPWCGLCVVMVP